MAHLTALSDAGRMDRHYRYQRFVYDRTRTHYLIGRQHLIKDLKPAPGESILEIGCGTAWNLARAHNLYPEAKFFGVDVSNAMLTTAAASLRRNGLENRIVLRQGDGTSFDAETLFGHAQFDRVFFSYALSMIPEWKIALEYASGLIAPGGQMHIVDFGQCDQLPHLIKRALFRFLAKYSVSPREELKDTIEGMAAANGFDVRFQPLHRGYTDYHVLARHSIACCLQYCRVSSSDQISAARCPKSALGHERTLNLRRHASGRDGTGDALW